LQQNVQLGYQVDIKSHNNAESSYCTVYIFVIYNDCPTTILPVFYAVEKFSFLTLREKLVLGAP